MCLLQVFASPRCDCPSSLFEITCTEITRQNIEDNFLGATRSQNISTTTKSPDQHLKLVSQNISPPKNCSIVPCTITSLTIEDSDLRGLDEQWLSRLGICPAALTILVVSSFWSFDFLILFNSDLEQVKNSRLNSLALPPLPLLQTLDLRDNKVNLRVSVVFLSSCV